MDVTKCTSEHCPMKDSCYRSQPKENDNQTCYNYEYTCNEYNGFCSYIQTNIKNN